MSSSLVFWLDTRYQRKNSESYPVKLQVLFDRLPYRYQLINVELSIAEFDLVLSTEKVDKRLFELRKTLSRILAEAITAAAALKPFTVRDFESLHIRNNPDFKPKKYKHKKEDPAKVPFDFTPFEKRFKILKEPIAAPEILSSLYVEMVKKLIKRGKIGTALNYQDSYNSIKKYFGNIPILQITEEGLYDYEFWMKSRGRKLTTIGIKLRHLRAIYNFAIAKNITGKNAYPFGKHKYLIPTGTSVKKALHDAALKAIYEADPMNENEKKAKLYWFFQFFGNGMNPKDCAKLKFSDVDGRIIRFQRAKTEETLRSTPKTIVVYMNDDMLYCMSQLARPKTSANDYVFPILENEMSDLDQHYKIKSFVKFVNHWMAKICKRIELPDEVTNQNARHSLATKLMRMGASTEYIKDTLGHENIRTTEKYLDGFEYAIKKEYAEKLAQFNIQSISTSKNSLRPGIHA